MLLLLLVVRVVIEKEEEEEEKRREKGWETVKNRPRVHSETSHQPPGASDATLHYQKPEEEQSQAGREKTRQIKTGSTHFPELPVKLPHSS